MAAGTKDEGIVLRRIASGHYAVIEFPPADPAQSGYLGPRLTAAVAAADHYRVLSKRPDGTVVYVNAAPAP